MRGKNGISIAEGRVQRYLSPSAVRALHASGRDPAFSQARSPTPAPGPSRATHGSSPTRCEALLPAGSDGELSWSAGTGRAAARDPGSTTAGLQIVWRRLGRGRGVAGQGLPAGRARRAIARRGRRAALARGLPRLVWSESDGLPGIVVDRFGDAAGRADPDAGDGAGGRR